MGRRGRPPYPDVLTPREFEVLDLLREGLSNEEIAGRLGISLAGAKYHVSEILGKLGVSSREEAARWQPGERPWWAAAFAPIAGLGRRGWLPWAAGGAVALAVAAGVALLIWGLVRSDGGASSAVAPETTPTQAQAVVPPTEPGATVAPVVTCVLPAPTLTNVVGQGQALAPETTGAGGVSVVTERADPSAEPTNVIRWCDPDGTVREQQLAVAQGDAVACFDCAVVAAAQQLTDGVRELGVAYDTTSLGSGSPTLGFALLRLEGAGWTSLWDTSAAPDWQGYHGHAQFPNADLSALVIQRDEWSGVFYEANAGPHRGFVDTWDRTGDAYALARSDMVPSAYGSLIEFVTDLNANDDTAAARWVTDPALIDTARSFGLQDAPGQHWMPTCAEPTPCGESAPIKFFEGAGPAVAISFVQEGSDWLISAIDPSPNQPFPS